MEDRENKVSCRTVQCVEKEAQETAQPVPDRLKVQEGGKGDGCFGGSYRWQEAQTLFTKQTLDEVIQGER